MTGPVEDGDANSSGTLTGPRLPGVFLMSNSFETGGSERQFAALAGGSRMQTCFVCT